MATRCWRQAAQTLRARAPPARLLLPHPSSAVRSRTFPHPLLARSLHIRFSLASVPPPPPHTLAPSPPAAAAATSGAAEEDPSIAGTQQQPRQGQGQGQGQGQNQSPAANEGTSWSTRIGVALFLSTAAVAVYLGQWQIKRRAWKEQLIQRRTAALDAPPVDLITYLATHPSTSAHPAASTTPVSGSTLVPSSTGSSDPSDVLLPFDDECRRLVARGHLLHDLTLRLGPRTPPSPDASSTAGQGSGYFLITPMRLTNGRMVLINRGWCPQAKCTPGSKEHYESGKEGEEEVEIVGVLRKGEAEPQFLSNYDPLRSGSFIWLDLPLMARVTGVLPASSDGASAAEAPVLLDALEVKGSGPAQQHMRRRTAGDYIVFTTTPAIHSVYAATWFTLAAALVALTAIRFRKKPPTVKKPLPWRRG